MNIKNETIGAPKDLTHVIEGIWITVADGPADEISSVQCCLPNGAWEIIFQLTPQRFCILQDGQQVWMPEMAGLATNGTPVYWQVRGGTILFGMLLLPETMELLTTRPTLLREVRYEDLRDYNQSVFEPLLTRAKKATTAQELADIVFAVLREHLLQPKADDHQPYFAEALRLIRSNVTSLNLDDLSGQLFVSKRQLQRIFQDKLGFGPKTYRRMLRFRDAIHFMQQNPDSRMIDVAYDFGYADQSHFIREFKDFTGQNPRRFFASCLPKQFASHHRMVKQ